MQLEESEKINFSDINEINKTGYLFNIRFYLQFVPCRIKKNLEEFLWNKLNSMN